MKALISVTPNHLMAVKIIKETMRIGLKEAKDMYDNRCIEGDPKLVRETLDKLSSIT